MHQAVPVSLRLPNVALRLLECVFQVYDPLCESVLGYDYPATAAVGEDGLVRAGGIRAVVREAPLRRIFVAIVVLCFFCFPSLFAGCRHSSGKSLVREEPWLAVIFGVVVVENLRTVSMCT